MKGCPLIKSILVRVASTTLYLLSSIAYSDTVNLNALNLNQIKLMFLLFQFQSVYI